MAFYNFKIKHSIFPKSLSLFYLLIITNFFSVPSPFTSALSFNFPNFPYSDTRIVCEGVSLENQAIQLTGSINVSFWGVGGAMYYKPMHLWDKASGNLTDFTTHFSFVIDSRNDTNYGDGLAFFLEPTDSKIPSTTPGGGMGLSGDNDLINTTANHFVAVEFDIFSNPQWDPPGVHVGIDIKSMKSVANVSWTWANYAITHGTLNEARISYNSTSHNLSVLLTGSINNSSTGEQSLSYNVDLRDHLPEWVTFGFSASTGLLSTMHTIYTWDFNSTLEDIVIVANIPSPNPNQATNPSIPSPNPNPAPNPSKKNKLGLAVGLGVGGCFLVGGFALIMFFLRKRNESDTEEDLAFDRSMDDEFQRGNRTKEVLL